MRLVNSDINSGFGHSGGVAELDAMAAKQPLNGGHFAVQRKKQC